MRRGLARSREQAAALVAAGRVQIAGTPASKAATAVGPGAALLVVPPHPEQPDYASRGGYKLAGMLDDCAGLAVAGRRCLDAGASTGGFTDVLLRRGAASVVAVDVGYGQLDWAVRSDPRVQVLDRTNVRSLEPAQVAPAPSLLVADLSFIGLALVLPALLRCGTSDADLVVLVKPQFEVGRDHLGAGGVVRDPELRARAVAGVAQSAHRLGLGVCSVAASSLPGPAGNVEYFLWLRSGARALEPDQLAHAIAMGPQ